MQEINCNAEECPTGNDFRMNLAFNFQKRLIYIIVYTFCDNDNIKVFVCKCIH